MNKLFLCKVSRECPHCGRDPLEGEIEFVVANNLKEVKEVLDENYDIYSDDFYYDPIIINRFDQIDKDYYSYEVFVPKNDKKHLFYYMTCLGSFIKIFRNKLEKYEKIECLENQLYLFDTKFSNKFQNRIQKNKEIIKKELKKAEVVMAKRFRGRMEYVF